VPDAVVSNVFGGVIDQLKQQSRVGRYRTDPALWAKDVLGITLWSKQEDVFAQIMENDHVSVRSCHGSGKSYMASIIACWWISVHPLGDAIVVTTAPTYHQVHSILWEDIRKHHINANQRFDEGQSPLRLPGKITQSDMWKTDDGILVGFGRKPADNNDHGFQGIHRPYVLVIVDESCGIRENLFTAVEAITTTQNSCILAIGNPDDPATAFKKFFDGVIDERTGKEIWANTDISSFDSPNFTRKHEGHYNGCEDPNCLKRRYAERWDRDKAKNLPDNVLALLPNEEWVEQRRAAWGEESSLWKSKVLGEFPLTAQNTLFSQQTLQRGADCEVKPLPSRDIILGVDVAYGGADYTVIYKYERGPSRSRDVDDKGEPIMRDNNRNGGKLRMVDFWGGKADEDFSDGTETAMRIHTHALNLGAKEVRIDSEGVGGPIMSQVLRLSDGAYNVVAMKGSAASPDKFRWINARAFWYDMAREAMFNHEIDMDPKDQKLRDELEVIQYHFKNRYASLQIESKDDMERRGVKSPDFADAAIYAMADISAITADPLSRYAIGDVMSMSVQDFLGLGGNEYVISPY